MKLIPLTNRPGLFVMVSDIDFNRVNEYKWFLKRGHKGCYYPARSIWKGKTVWLHRFIVDCPTGLTVDHINMNKLDCTRENLEIVSQSENSKRRHRAEIPI